MDRARRLLRFFAGMNRPGARFFFARRQERSQAEQMINRPNKRMDAAVFHTNAAQILKALLLVEIDKFAFDLRADQERFGSEMMLRVILNKGDIFSSRI